jgi:hypothetical protein
VARSEISVTIRDFARTRLFLWELRQLHDEMRVMASPHADRLERLLDRWVDADLDDDAA